MRRRCGDFFSVYRGLPRYSVCLNCIHLCTCKDINMQEIDIIEIERERGLERTAILKI